LVLGKTFTNFLSGRDEGKAWRQLEAAKKMLSKGMSLADILYVTSLKEADLRDWELIK